MFFYILFIGIILILLFIILRQRKLRSADVQSNSQEMLANTSQLPSEVLQKLTELLQKQQTHQEQLIQNQLMNLFRIPKLRGIQGEKWLESQLQEVLPHQHFSIQYTFATGTICDAVVFLPNGKIIPI